MLEKTLHLKDQRMIKPRYFALKMLLFFSNYSLNLWFQ